MDRDLLFEAGVGIGGMDCVTDLGGPRGKGGYYFNEINWRNTELSGSAYLSVMFKHTIGIRLEATVGTVKAYDSILKGVATAKGIGRYTRNLSFRSSIKELALLTEIHPLELFNTNESPARLSPYLLTGIGVFSFNPKAFYRNVWVPLQPLSTEGQGFGEYPQRKPYSLTDINISAGAGIRYELKNFNLRLEFVHRILRTDYLDDVSTKYIDSDLFVKYLTPADAANAIALHNRSGNQLAEGSSRGAENKKDAYMSFNIKVGFKFGSEGLQLGRNKPGIGCKSW